jgi:hypothetical protein
LNQDSPNVLTKTMALSAVLEIATGLALMVDPALVIRLLLDAGATDDLLMVGRFLGIALFAMGIAGWPNEQRSKPDTAAYRGLLTYNVLVPLFLAYLYFSVRAGGVLLWPAVVAHAIVAVLMIRALRGGARNKASAP